MNKLNMNINTYKKLWFQCHDNGPINWGFISNEFRHKNWILLPFICLLWYDTQARWALCSRLVCVSKLKFMFNSFLCSLAPNETVFAFCTTVMKKNPFSKSSFHIFWRCVLLAQFSVLCHLQEFFTMPKDARKLIY